MSCWQAEKCAAYQRRVEELSALLQQSNDDREALRVLLCPCHRLLVSLQQSSCGLPCEHPLEYLNEVAGPMAASDDPNPNMPDIVRVWVVQDQNGAMEIELNDLKSRIDSDVMENRALEEKASAVPRLEVHFLETPLQLFGGTLSQALIQGHILFLHRCTGLGFVGLPCVAMRGQDSAHGFLVGRHAGSD